MPFRSSLRLFVSLLVATCAVSTSEIAASRSTAQAASAAFFSPTSFWNQQVPGSAPLDPNSAAMVADLNALVTSEELSKAGPWINSSSNGVAIVTVPADQPTVQVTLNHSPDPALSAAWSAVPLPPSAQPSGGDGDLAVWQPSTNRMWEFWGLSQQAGGWHARWGGAMQNVSSNPGVYGSDAWLGAENWWGVTAASFPIVGGAMTLDELASGQINHALALSLPNVRAGVFADPAKRDDGTSQDPNSLPEGARLRIDPNLNLASLNLPPLVLMMAQAAQSYGIIIRDYAGNVAFDAQDPTQTGSTVLKTLYQGTYPNRLLASFPWSHLQVLTMNLHTNP